MPTLYADKLTPTAITATTAAAGYPALNLANEKLAKPYRATGTGANDITIDLGAVKALAALELHDVNFAAAAISTSDDNVTYTPRGTLTTYANVHGRRRGLLALPSLMARYVRASLPAGDRAYVVMGFGSNLIKIVDPATNAVISTIAAASSASAIAVNQDASRAYVSLSGSSQVAVINLATNAVIATIGVGATPQAIAINPAGTRVYCLNYDSTVSIINTATNAVIATVAVGSSGFGDGTLAVNAAGTRVYIANPGGNTVSVIDTSTNTVVATVAVGTTPTGVAINPAGTRVYVTNSGTTTVSVIDTSTNTVTATVNVGTAPYGVAVNPAGTFAYVANQTSGDVSVINTATNTVSATIAAIGAARGVGINAGGTRAYVVSAGTNNVSVINTATNTVLTTIAVAAIQTGMYVGPRGYAIPTDALAYWRAGAAYVLATALALPPGPEWGYNPRWMIPSQATALANGQRALARTTSAAGRYNLISAHVKQFGTEDWTPFFAAINTGTCILSMDLPAPRQSQIWPVTLDNEEINAIAASPVSDEFDLTLREVV